MQALINELMEKAGLDATQAEKAVETMMNFIKSKLPAGFSDKVESLLSGNFDLSSMFGGSSSASPLDALKGMFGNE